MRATGKRVGCAVWVLAAITVATTSCGIAGETKTAASFCKVYVAEKTNYLKRYAPYEKAIAPNDPKAGAKALTAIVMGVQSLGDVTVILTKFEKAAPDDIEPDMAAVLDSWKKMQDTLGSEASHAFDPKGLLGDVVKGALVGAMSNGSWTRAGEYITKNCTA